MNLTPAPCTEATGAGATAMGSPKKIQESKKNSKELCVFCKELCVFFHV
jgi:hypothetical protein